jgi:type III restriction enzyme
VHEAAKRWVLAVNNWGNLGKSAFHVCKDPQVLGQELGYLVKATHRMMEDLVYARHAR